MVFNPPATSYEEVPYANDPYRSSHPDNLAVVARLSGLTPALVNHCRVLELGCARGGNLIPMAVGLPQSRFVGIDSSPAQIGEARAVIDALGLCNIEVHSRNILDVDVGLGTFDYIICHGTFSWVPADVQEKILEILERNLSPAGIGFVSYNTYPGWHLRGIVRDMMSYHVRRYDRPADRAAEARTLLSFMANSASAVSPVYGNLLKEELDAIRDRPNSYLLHDHLEPVNQAVYFHEFIDRARSNGLQYVSEVQDSLVGPESLAHPVAEGLRQLSRDRIEFEQFVDFVINRKFRQSVLCRSGVPTGRTVSFDELGEVYVASRHKPPQTAVAFRDAHVLGVALGYLNEIWPLAVTFTSLLESVRMRVPSTRMGEEPSPGGRKANDLGTDLIRCYSLRLVELSTLPPRFVVTISDKPVASPLARLQSATSSTVTNLRHEAGQLGDFGRFILPLLNGERDRRAILSLLEQSVKDGRLAIPRSGPPVEGGSMNPGRPHDVGLPELLDRSLKKFARFALLVA